MLFKFIGDPRNKGDGPDVLRMYGHRFDKNGDPVDVTDPVFIGKLEGNRHFKKVDGRTKEAKKNANKG